MNHYIMSNIIEVGGECFYKGTVFTGTPDPKLSYRDENDPYSAYVYTQHGLYRLGELIEPARFTTIESVVWYAQKELCDKFDPELSIAQNWDLACYSNRDFAISWGLPPAIRNAVHCDPRHNSLDWTGEQFEQQLIDIIKELY